MSEHDDKIERQMAFIIEQQAQAEVRRAQDDKRWAEYKQQWAESGERWQEIAGSVRALLAIVEIHRQEHLEHYQNHDNLKERIAELVAAGQRTDERLNALITVVERDISGRGGQS
jgi:hypothetical protein